MDGIDDQTPVQHERHPEGHSVTTPVLSSVTRNNCALSAMVEVRAVFSWPTSNHVDQVWAPIKTLLEAISIGKHAHHSAYRATSCLYGHFRAIMMMCCREAIGSKTSRKRCGGSFNLNEAVHDRISLARNLCMTIDALYASSKMCLLPGSFPSPAAPMSVLAFNVCKSEGLSRL